MTATPPSSPQPNSSAPASSSEWRQPPRANGRADAAFATYKAVYGEGSSGAVREQQQRSDFMDELYRRSGRTSGHYTGLWQQFRREAFNQFMNMFADELAEMERADWIPPSPLQQP